MEERNWKPNVVVYISVMDGLCKDGLVYEVLNLFSEMSGKCVLLNHITYTCSTQGLCNFGRWKEVGSLLDEMTKMGMMPDLQAPSIF